MVNFPYSLYHNNKTLPSLSESCYNSEHDEEGNSGCVENNFDRTELVS